LFGLVNLRSTSISIGGGYFSPDIGLTGLLIARSFFLMEENLFNLEVTTFWNYFSGPSSADMISDRYSLRLSIISSALFL
jgi:hypothetical protein